MMTPIGQAIPGFVPNAGNPATAPNQGPDSMSLPMFNVREGNTDTGVSHTGDLGGAGKL